MATTQLHRIAAGYYETLDGTWTIVRNPAGWVVYETADPYGADAYETLADARNSVAQR